MKPTSLNLFLVRLALVVIAIAGGDAIAADTFEKYVNEKAGFQVLMPPNPQYNEAKQGPGPDDVQHQFLAGGATGVYMVAYQDHPNLDVSNPDTAEAVFVVARDAFQKAVAGERTAYKTIKLGDHEGREMSFKIPAKGGEARSRMFFANKRWYHVFVMGTPEFVAAKDTTRFLDSFRILEPAAE